ncbi:MOS1T transposase, partial [Pseudoatta argentina]
MKEACERENQLCKAEEEEEEHDEKEEEDEEQNGDEGGVSAEETVNKLPNFDHYHGLPNNLLNVSYIAILQATEPVKWCKICLRVSYFEFPLGPCVLIPLFSSARYPENRVCVLPPKKGASLREEPGSKDIVEEAVEEKGRRECWLRSVLALNGVLHLIVIIERPTLNGFTLPSARETTGDEKWIHYDNPKRRKSWGKPGHASTSSLYLVGSAGCNLLSTITGDRYRLQLMRLSRALKEKRPLYAQRHDKVILLHWEALPHPPYSPDIAPSDFHLFRSMAHGLADRRFHSYEEAQKWIDSWIASKDMWFFRRGIHVLPERWSKVVESDVKYFH